MTSIEKESVTCPKCGKKFETELYGSVNITLDPTLLRDLYDRKINSVKCPKCKVTIIVAQDVIFHDMKFKGKDGVKSLIMPVKAESWPIFWHYLDGMGYFDKFKEEDKKNGTTSK